MQIGDLEKWSIDQLKIEVVRLSTACEKKQHEILDKNNKINELQAELDKMYDYSNELKRQVCEKADMPFYDESIEIAKCLNSIRRIALRLTSCIQRLMF